MDIDKTGVAAYFNSDSKPYDVTAAIAVSGDRLYAAFRTGDPNLLRNSGEVPNAPFKTGGTLDLMLATDPAADPHRKDPAPVTCGCWSPASREPPKPSSTAPWSPAPRTRFRSPLTLAHHHPRPRGRRQRGGAAGRRGR